MQKLYNTITETIGNTPIIKLNKITKDLPHNFYVKVEYFNPGGSVKDRIAKAMIDDAEAKGVLKPGATIIEPTSGNTGMGLALAACVKGYKCIFTTTDKQSKEKADILKAVGAEVIVCPTNVEPEDPRSYYSIARRLSTEIPNSFWCNQYDNLSNRQAQASHLNHTLGRAPLILAPYDAELFGHWWHEGPVWLERLLRRLPEAGVTVGSLSTARERGFVGAPVDLPASSWGSGKDWRVWAGPQVQHFVDLNAEVVGTALDTVDKRHDVPATARDRVNDQILRETLMTVASDWPFMVSKDTAGGYATDRAHKHAHAAREIADAAARGRESTALSLADGWFAADNMFADLDARRLPGPEAYTDGGR